QGEHVEWSIDFRQLRAASAQAGLAVEELPLHALLGADLSVRCASYTDLWRLRRVASCEVFAAPEAEVRRRFPLLSRALALDVVHRQADVRARSAAEEQGRIRERLSVRGGRIRLALAGAGLVLGRRRGGEEQGRPENAQSHFPLRSVE